MATIPTPGSELRHVRKTITFDGTAGNGAIGTVTVFTITGRVLLEIVAPVVTADLISAGAATVAFGYPSGGRSTLLIDATDYSNLLATGMWTGAYGVDVTRFAQTVLPQMDSTSSEFGRPLYFDANPTFTIAGAAVTGGTIVVDIWYRPITDDGALAGDDIDEDLKTNIWSKALSDISSVPAITASALSGLNWLFALARNKRTQTATTETVYKDDGSTSLATSTKSDDGTTYTRGEYS